MTTFIITLLLSTLVYSNAAQINYYTPKLERNSILNKGLWTKEKIHKSNYGDFIFKADVGDADNLLQNNFDAFVQSDMDTVPVFSNYVERSKRSTIFKQNQRLKKNIMKCKNKMTCLKGDDDTQTLYKSKFISKLRPTSVFNDYPYEVAVLLATSNKREISNNDKTKPATENIIGNDKNLAKNKMKSEVSEQNNTNGVNFKSQEETETGSDNKSVYNITKRRMTLPRIELELNDNTSLVDVNNETIHIDGNKIHRNVFDKEEIIWQGAPVKNMVLPIPEDAFKNKPVTEKGLVKVLSLLTKTFKKVMKQHNDIQEIDMKIHNLHESFMKNVATVHTKFKEFDTKYTQVIKMNEELQQLSEKFTKKNVEEIAMTQHFREFENQQKKFLAQQHQFYTIQKFILDQNEKINHKQNLIAKTQSEISHRQNHFARVLKKAKQLYMDNKFLTGSKLDSIINKQKNSSTIGTDYPNKVTLTTPTTSEATESVKINLFSIPNFEPLLNHDKLIIEEKNKHPVDDLVYKYYFNNTFIDKFMKNKVLTAIINNEGKNTRHAKNKRNDITNETTILLPIGSAYVSPIGQNLNREKRWIRHPNKISKTKFHAHKAVIDKGKIQKGINEDMKMKNEPIDDIRIKNDPFLMMATNFCNEVGQNLHVQMLNWCVEKSLRKLKSIDMILPIKALQPPPVENISEKVMSVKANEVNQETSKLFPLNETEKSAYLNNKAMVSTTKTLKSTSENVLAVDRSPDLFFPGNDELESNLKQYELNPDPEGTVYFDGSLHTSDMDVSKFAVISESEALSDVMPGLDSNSHVDVDPLALDLQARRRAYVRRLNENIMKSMNTQKRGYIYGRPV